MNEANVTHEIQMDVHDEPLRDGDKDLLGRQGFIEHLATVIHAAPADASVVFAVYSPWGSGKSSLIPLLKSELESKDNKPEMVVFNPWLFSGREMLFQTFFEEVGGTLQSSLVAATQDVGKKMRMLGMVLSGTGKAVSTANSLLGIMGLAIPMGEIIAAGAKGAGEAAKAAHEYQKELLEKSPPKSEDLFKALEEAVRQADRPFLIIMDDLDRLLPSEAVEMLQLVKASCRVPGIHFLILADNKALCSHLMQQKLESSYLEKIVQYAVPLPDPPSGRLRKLLLSSLKGIIASHAQRALPTTVSDFEIFVTKCLMPSVRTVRDAKRFLNVVRFAIPLTSSDDFLEVNLEDLLCVLLIHAFDEPTYQSLARSKNELAPDRDVLMMFEAMRARDHQNQNASPPRKDWFEKASRSLVEREKSWLCCALEYVVHPNEKRGGRMPNDWQRRLISSTHFDGYFRLSRPENIVPQSVLMRICDPETSFDDLLTLFEDVTQDIPIDEVGQQILAKFEDPARPTPSVALVSAFFRIVEQTMFEDNSVDRDIPYDLLTLYLRRSRKKTEESLDAVLQQSRATTLLAYCLDTYKTDSECSPGIFDSIALKISKQAEERAKAQELMVCEISRYLCELWRPRGDKELFENWFKQHTSTPAGLLRMVNAFGRLQNNRFDGHVIRRFFEMPTVYLMKHWPDPKSAAERLRSRIEQEKPDGDLLVTMEDAQRCLEEADRLLQGKVHFAGELGFLVKASFTGNLPSGAGGHARVGLLLPPISIPPSQDDSDTNWAQTLAVRPDCQGSTIVTVNLPGYPTSLEGLAVVGDEVRLRSLAPSFGTRFFYLFEHESRYVCDMEGESIHWIDPTALK